MSLLLLAAHHAGWRAATGWPLWALFCVSSTFVSLAQPAVGMAFPPALAGRALSAYNLVIFAGVFTVQWGIGLLIDAFAARWAGSRWRAFGGAWPSSVCVVCRLTRSSCAARKADNRAQPRHERHPHHRPRPAGLALRQCVLHVFPDSADAVSALDVQPNVPPEETLAQARIAGARSWAPAAAPWS